ncbi:hypothetical protein ACIGZJ_13565 [Kitasatospora sp. NPDC052868]|uniref:hypothetical protein n=1 Tax=Kitasatospora sp. NPDC052868 TaxID=3364060 RepID=UPI0037C845F0
MSGIRPQLKIGERFTSCIVLATSEDELFLLGQEYEVDLQLVFREEYQDLLTRHDPIELFDGSKLIATGRWADDGNAS